MVAKVSFLPVGNGDTSQIVLDNNRWLLFDFHHQKKSEEEGSTDFNLKKHLKDQLKAAKRDYYDVLALTHGDDDHIRNSTEFFELWHAAKYQGILTPVQIEGLRMLLTPFPQEEFNQTEDRKSADQSLASHASTAKPTSIAMPRFTRHPTWVGPATIATRQRQRALLDQRYPNRS